MPMHLNFTKDVRTEGAAEAKLSGHRKGTFITWQSTGVDIHLSYVSPSDEKAVHLRMAWDVTEQGDIRIGLATDRKKGMYGSLEELVAGRMYLNPELIVPGTQAKVEALMPLDEAEGQALAAEDGAGMRRRIKPRPEPDVSHVVRSGINPATGKFEVVDPSKSLSVQLRKLVTPRFVVLVALAGTALALAGWLLSTLAQHANLTELEVSGLVSSAHAVAGQRVEALRAGLHEALANVHHTPSACADTLSAWSVETAHAVQPLQAEFMQGDARHKLTALLGAFLLSWICVIATVLVGSGRATPEDIAEREEAAGRPADVSSVRRLQGKEPWAVRMTGHVFWVALLLSYAVLLLAVWVGQGELWNIGAVQSAFDDRFYRWHSHRGWWSATNAGKSHPGPDAEFTPTVLAHMLEVPEASIDQACVQAVDRATEEYTDDVPHILLLPLPAGIDSLMTAAVPATFGLISEWVLAPGVPAHTATGHGDGDLDGAPAHAALDQTRFVLPNLTYAARSFVCFIPALFLTVVLASYIRQGVLDVLAGRCKRSAPTTAVKQD